MSGGGDAPGAAAPESTRPRAAIAGDDPAAATEIASLTPVLHAVVRVLRKRRRLAIGCFLLTLGVALLVTLLTPRRYTASTRVQMASASPTAVATEVVALQSRDLAERVIVEYGLLADPRLHPEGDARGTGRVDAHLLDHYASFLSVHAARDPGSIEILFTTPSPMLSVLLATSHAEAYQATVASSPPSPVAPPALPTWPSRPNVLLNLTLGAGAGIVLAVGAAMARELTDRSVATADDVTDLLGLPTLALIPGFAPRPEAFRAQRMLGAGRRADARGHDDTDDLVVLRAPGSGAADAFRRLRAAPPFSGPLPRVVLVTSAGVAEGKTVVAVNLAATLAAAGARVLVIDGDLRSPRCHAVFGVSNLRGLATYLAGESDLPALVQDVADARLSFLAAGAAPANPTSLIGSGHMRGLLARLRWDYDCIVLDAPPALLVTDAVLLARDADAVVLVVHAHTTPGAVVTQASERLAAGDARLSGVILNRVAVD